MKTALKKLFVYSVTAILVILLMTPAAIGEEAAWDCPVCGRTGNTGNFCGSCASPRPGDADPTGSIVFKDFTIVSAAGQDPGTAEIAWIGGTEPVTVSVSHYFNSDHNNGAGPYYIKEGWESHPKEGIGVISGLVPGERYWIRLADANGNEAWYDYAAEESPAQSEWTVRIHQITQKYQNKNQGKQFDNWNLLPKNATTVRLEEECSRGRVETIIQVYLQFGNVRNDTSVRVSGALVLPNGDVIPGSNSQTVTISRSQNRVEFNNEIPWKAIYDAYGCIPVGTSDRQYTHLIYIDDHLYLRKNFILVPELQLYVQTPAPLTDPIG